MFTNTITLIAICIAGLSSSNVDELITAAKSKSKDQRIVAIGKLGDIVQSLSGDEQKKVAETIIRSVSDPFSLVVSAAKLEMAEQPELFNQYLGPFVKSDEFREFAYACESIKAIGTPAKKWLQPLEKKLDHEKYRFRLAALHALAHLDGKETLPLLDKVIHQLDDKNFNVQLSACRVIANIGPDANKAGPRLVKLMAEGIASSRSWASIALGAIGPHKDYDVVKLLEKRLGMFYLVDRQRALEGLAYLGDHAKSTLPLVEKLMRDLSKSVPHTAARTHWKISGDPELAIEALTKLVPTMDFGVESMDILAEMGDEAKSAVPALVKQLRSTEAPTREAAVYALSAIGAAASEAIDDLEKMEADEDVLIRAAAKSAIKKIKSAQKESESAD